MDRDADYRAMPRQISEAAAIEALLALAQPIRLDVFRRLIRCYPDEIAAGELARQCKTPHNSMSTHLAVLTCAGLLAARKEGRMMHYGARFDRFQALIAYLLQDCCNGRAEICAPLVAQLSCCLPDKERKKSQGATARAKDQS